MQSPLIDLSCWVATGKHAGDVVEFVNKFVHGITIHDAYIHCFPAVTGMANQIRPPLRNGIMVSGKPCLWDNSPTWVRQIANRGETDAWRQYVDVMTSNSMEQTNYVVDAG